MAKKKRTSAPQTSNSPAIDERVKSCLDSQATLPPTPVTSLLTTSHVVTIAKFFTRQECAQLAQVIDSAPELSTTKQKRTAEYTYRHNDRLQFESPSIASLICSRLKRHPSVSDLLEFMKTTSTDIDVNPNIRLYRYLPSMQFGPHYDESTQTSNGKTTRWTVLIYLNSLERGGETNFFLNGDATNTSAQNLLSVPPVEGTILLHLHGDDCLLHEGAEVTAGVKYLFRTDLCF
ncbi:hypothetical protein TrST_g1018 [Triparma strigata]|uniref:Fe2OG dioxygenase domain-containing protein n=1 Tax=Triparma strigata TaxID=1606541 RepID=A0A9W6ZWN4_9STRA|nr:hypothetical protein TrST_g1018 [Triparma strigata]